MSGRWMWVVVALGVAAGAALFAGAAVVAVAVMGVK